MEAAFSRDADGLSRTSSDPWVFLPMLSPRFPAGSRPGGAGTFWQRFKEIESLLVGFRAIQKGGRRPQMRIVCVDSLNVFGDGPLSRDELRQLMGLFRRHEVIGLFTAEEGEAGSTSEMEYLADVVMRLHAGEENGYFLRHLEIEKSRYQQQVNGRHPFKIRGMRERVASSSKGFFQAIMAYPSLHYVSSATTIQQSRTVRGADSRERVVPDLPAFDIGIQALADIVVADLQRPAIVTIRGDRGTYKTCIAHTFLLDGIRCGENAMLLTLGEKTQFEPDRHKANWMVCREILEETNTGHGLKQRLVAGFSEIKTGGSYIDDTKLCRRVWSYNDKKEPRLVEIAFRQGALLPEQFVECVRDVLRSYSERMRPWRVVLDDVSLVGSSYPFLRHSETAGDLALPTLVHVLRAANANLVITGTPGGFAEADEAVNRACTLSDTVLSCNFCDVFGKRFVAVTGEGLKANRGGGEPADVSGVRIGSSEAVPPVIVPQKDNYFAVDRTKLQGLVGHDRGEIYRPGVVVNLFREGEVLEHYNAEIRTMLERAFACPSDSGRDLTSGSGGDEKVTVFEFGSDKSEAVHDSLKILGGKPVERTVVYAVDEFYSESSGEGRGVPQTLGLLTKGDLEGIGERDEFRHWSADSTVPYYSNVLLVAYNRELVARIRGRGARTIDWEKRLDWRSLSDCLATGSPIAHDVDDPADKGSVVWPFECGAWSGETLACVLLDALISAGRYEPDLGKVVELACAETNRRKTERILCGLGKLFHRSFRSWVRAAPEKRKRWGRRYHDRIIPNAAVYVCWYSQLRELIEEHPELATKLSVCALPGDGVTGDWYLGVAAGSVSMKLGISVLNILCSQNEEYKRFIRGVGLPVRNAYEDSAFVAWPNARRRTLLRTILQIHERARARSRIVGYQESRAALGTLGTQLAYLRDSAREDFVTSLLDRLGPMVGFLMSSRSRAYPPAPRVSGKRE
jgi:KaiC/GvpD/RAD55 family RecA-like ATPase